MIEEILPKFYRVEVPLPRNPLKILNSYMIKASGRALIIDTGMNREECLTVMRESIAKLGIDLNKTDFFITHMHADHLGLASTLTSQTSRVYFNKPEAVHVHNPGRWEWGSATLEFARRYGFPDEELEKAITNHPGLKYMSKVQPDFTILKEGDVLIVGDYSLQCIETPGHTRGHICLYEARHKLFLSGDHILGDITPNISTRFNSEENPLAQYLQSLDKVYNLEVARVLPGHRNTLTDLKKRIRELKQHHEARANEQLEILGSGDQNAFQIASRMTWDMPYENWAQFPPFQKWFAFGETMAHLHYLESLGKVRQKTLTDQKTVYSLV